MFDPVVAITDGLLTDYLFGQLDLDGQIQVEYALSKDPELAARMAGSRAKMLAIRRLTDGTFEQTVPSVLIDALKPLLEDQNSPLRPQAMASWLVNGELSRKSNGSDRNGAFLHDGD